MRTSFFLVVMQAFKVSIQNPSDAKVLATCMWNQYPVSGRKLHR